MSGNPADYRTSAKLLETQRLLFDVMFAAQTAPAGALAFIPVVTTLLPITLKARINQLYRARIVAGVFFSDHPTTLSIESGGLAVLTNATHFTIAPGGLYINPMQWGGITALADGQPLKTDWVELRAQDWPAVETWGLIPVVRINNTGGADASCTIQAKVEVQRYLFDAYDLPQPEFSD